MDVTVVSIAYEAAVEHNAPPRENEMRQVVQLLQ